MAAATAIARVLRPGPALGLQDAGRPGWRRFGIPPGGWLDPAAAARANALLGNPTDLPALEFALGGTVLEILRPTWLALAGAAGARDFPAESARPCRAGEVLEFTPTRPLAWSVLAVPGGWLDEPVFGSVSRLAHAGLGQALGPDAVLHAPNLARPDLFPGVALRRPAKLPPIDPEPVLRLLPGPHHEAFTAAELAPLTTARWTIDPRSDRSGYRLLGPPLPPGPNIPSLPVLPGCIQISRSGRPIVILADGPTVGGYPIPALVDPDDLSILAQRPPLAPLRLRWQEGAAEDEPSA